MQKLFLDTNIIIDFLGERKNFYEPAAKILTLADKKKIKILTSPTSISNAYYLLAKYEDSKSALEKIRKFKVLEGQVKILGSCLSLGENRIWII